MNAASLARLSLRCTCALGLALMLSACREPQTLGYSGSGHDATDQPGAPRSPVQIHRRLLEDGYELQSPPIQSGAVVFANVRTVEGEPKCIILHAFSGTILQRFKVGPRGLVAEIHHTPGPGFPGYPPVPDARYADLCALVIPVVQQDPLVIPGIGPETLRMRY